MKTCILAACALLVGCGGNVFKVDSRFTSEEETKIQAAADAWAAVGAEPIDFIWRARVNGIEAENVIMRSTAREVSYRYRKPAEDRGCIGYTHQNTFDGKQVYILMDRIDDTQPGVNFRATVTHELGHVLLHGGDEVHVARDEAIMNPSPIVDAISVFDVAALRARQ